MHSKLVVTVPLTHADIVRQAIGAAIKKAHPYEEVALDVYKLG